MNPAYATLAALAFGLTALFVISGLCELMAKPATDRRFPSLTWLRLGFVTSLAGVALFLAGRSLQ